MSEVAYLASAVTRTSNMTSATTFSPPTTTVLPWEDSNMQAHLVVIVGIFCVVCFLHIVAFFYAFCVRCSIKPSPKDAHAVRRCSLELEYATYRGSSSDGQSVANVV